MSQPWTDQFLDLAVQYQALRFGEFTLKSGRTSPYFFNAGLFSDGQGLDRLAGCYAAAIQASKVGFDMLYGPAYKGIPLAAAIAVRLHRDFGRNVPFAYNRKEAKDHGEGGSIVGAELAGRVLIIDDVISAGTSIRESREIIQRQGAEAAAVAIALDRQERGSNDVSAVDEVRAAGLTVVSVADLDDLIDWLEHHDTAGADRSAMLAYRQRYGV
ncbi:MAG: orotate phosphoribosyltransferase [Pseudomonadota bacterium]